MPIKAKKRKHNRTYFENNFIDPMILEGKEVCPLCRVQPQKILQCSSGDGNIVFFKQCNSCKGIIRIERKSRDI